MWRRLKCEPIYEQIALHLRANLSTRAINILSRLDWPLEQFLSASTHEFLTLRNLGRLTLVEFLNLQKRIKNDIQIASVSRNISDESQLRQKALTSLTLLLPLKSFIFSERAKEYFKRRKAQFVGDILPFFEKVAMTDRNVGKRTCSEITSFLKMLNILPELAPSSELFPASVEEREKRHQELKAQIQQVRCELWAGKLEPCCFATALERCLDNSSEYSDILKIRLSYASFHVNKCPTLEEVGDAYGVTRERVRQIEVRFFEHLLSSFTWFPQWNQFFDFWKDLPVSINVMGAVEPFYQFHKGQWNKGVPLLFLHTVMERMTPELENGRIIVLKDNLQTLTRLEPRMTRVESRHYRELVDEYKEASGVLVSESLSGTGKQLLERKGWRLIDEYYFSKVPQPPWVGALRKILSITENISLSEFRKLAFYDPRITWLPPAKTLIKLVPWLCEFASIDGYNINRATMLNRKEQLGALENAIVDAFESSGKHILSVDQIVEYANRLQQERFETSSVLQYTSRSVILDRIPRTGLRFLVGTQISPTQIEAAKESLKGIGNRRGILGYTWVNRNLLLLYRLGSLPTFYIPKVCSNVLSGTFRIIAPAHGIIKIRNGLAWGASPIIRRFQSSGSRRVMYIFDPDTHEVSMVFGDDSLCIPSM